VARATSAIFRATTAALSVGDAALAFEWKTICACEDIALRIFELTCD
jgi:hypothetical protein